MSAWQLHALEKKSHLGTQLGLWASQRQQKSRERMTMMTMNMAKECTNVQTGQGFNFKSSPIAFHTFVCEHFALSMSVSGIRCLYCALKLQRCRGTSLALAYCKLSQKVGG